VVKEGTVYFILERPVHPGFFNRDKEWPTDRRVTPNNNEVPHKLSIKELCIGIDGQFMINNNSGVRK
jgi:hypothetical protein